jgi:alkylated DNA repair dioxygenase AlkB
MKQYALLFVAALALAAGCEKSSDVAPVAAEAHGIAESYQPRLAELQQRVDDLERRRNALRPGAEMAQASMLLAEVSKLLLQMQTAVREAPARIERTAQEDKLVELRAYSHQVQRELDGTWTRANAQLDLAAGWVSREEQRSRMQAAAPATPPAAAPSSDLLPPGQLPAGSATAPVE